MMADITKYFLFAETTADDEGEGNEPEPTEHHGVDLQFDALSDSEYGGDDLLSGYDVELFSTDAASAEIDSGIRERNLNEDIKNEYFLMPSPAPESLADEITRELNGGTLFDESQSQLKYSSASRKRDNEILLIVTLIVVGVMIGITSALLWRKLRKRARAGI